MPRRTPAEPQSLHAYVDGAIARTQPGRIQFSPLSLFLGIVLIPLVWVTLSTVWNAVATVTVQHSFWKTPQFWFFHMGIALWILFYIGFRGPFMVFAYVFGHEWTHAFFAVICGGKLLSRPVITSNGGEVVTTKNNVIISLSPYFVPFYSVLLGLLYLVLGFFFELGTDSERWFYGLTGFSWGFHITFTFWMLARSQPDLQHNGRFFSLSFIALVNVLILAALFVMASPTVGWAEFAYSWWSTVQELGARLWALR